MRGKTGYIKPKVVGSFPEPCASESYMHQAALFKSSVVVFVVSTTMFTAPDVSQSTQSGRYLTRTLRK
jgi:hypothetical protein